MSTDQSQTRAKPPQIPSDMKAFNRQLIEDFRRTNGQMSGQMAGRKLLLLTTKGAKSGQEKTVVLGYGKPADNQYVVIASNNGAVSHPFWYRNLLKNPQATVEVGAEKFSATARTASAEEHRRYSPLVPYIDSQQKLTDRQIPIVVLERQR
ncbi:MAG TPA: nitroreductase family deazaflavin-dependent oxidoreductase [Candidatus Dormibacteraeota bacterium]